jgi:hypothetical protein
MALTILSKTNREDFRKSIAFISATVNFAGNAVKRGFYG